MKSKEQIIQEVESQQYRLGEYTDLAMAGYMEIMIDLLLDIRDSLKKD